MTINDGLALGMLANVVIAASAWGRNEFRAAAIETRVRGIEDALGISGGKLGEPAFLTRVEAGRIEHVNDAAFKRIEDRLDVLEARVHG